MTTNLLIDAYQKLYEYSESLIEEISSILPDEHSLIYELELCMSNIYMHLSLSETEFVDVNIYKELSTSFSGNKSHQTVSFYTKEKFSGDSRLITDFAELNSLFTISNCLPLFRIVPMQIASNAKKYMPDSGELSVTLITKNNDIHILFSNYGPSCTEEDIEHIFEEGFRGEQSDIAAGLGVGLAEIKKIVDLHSWHEMECDVNSDNKKSILINGCKYSEFCIELMFSQNHNNFEQHAIEEVINSTPIILMHNSYDIADKLIRICDGMHRITRCRMESDKLRTEVNLFLDKIRYCQYLYNDKKNISYLLANKCRINIGKVFEAIVNNLKRFYYPDLKKLDIRGALKPIDSYSCMYSVMTGFLYYILSCCDSEDDIYIRLEDDTILIEGFECDIRSRLENTIEKDCLEMYESILSELKYNILYDYNVIKILLS